MHPHMIKLSLCLLSPQHDECLLGHRARSACPSFCESQASKPKLGRVISVLGRVTTAWTTMILIDSSMDSRSEHQTCHMYNAHSSGVKPLASRCCVSTSGDFVQLTIILSTLSTPASRVQRVGLMECGCQPQLFR